MTEEDIILKKLNEELNGINPKEEGKEEPKEEEEEEIEEEEEEEPKEAVFKHNKKQIKIKPKADKKENKPICPYCKLSDDSEKITSSDDKTIYRYGKTRLDDIYYCHRCGRRYGVTYDE